MRESGCERSSVPRYSGVAIALHWTSAVLVFCGFALGLYMAGLTFSPAKLRYLSWHKWIGITIFLVAGARIAWRIANPPPPLPASVPGWQRQAAHVSHLLLYALMLAIPLSGWLYSSASGVSVVYLGLVPLPDLVAKDKATASTLLAVHQTLNYVLAAMVVLHVGAALRHGLVGRDGVLERMLPRRRTPP
jgi:cytochrome b561